MSAVRASQLALHALILAMLGACASGGGGGGGSPPVVTPPAPPGSPPSFPPLAPPHAAGDFPNLGGAEYNANWGVAGTNAAIAWQNGATGAGVVVGVLDDGIDPNHPELVGRISPLSTDIVAGRNALVTTQSHGSEISSLITGNYNNSQTVGVAFDATILAVRADNGSGSFSDNALADAIDYARTNGVDVINLSLGSPSPSSNAFIDAMQRATQAGIIFVVSAGNDGTDGATQVNYPGFLATNASVSNGLVMVAGGLNPNGTVNPVSNPPGAAANWYMTAPGWAIIVPDHGPPGAVPGFQVCSGGLCQIQGTSYASPHIAGAVALVMDAFPGLTPTQVVDLLFTTADDTGAAGIDSVNGRGRLNIGRAFQPVGPLMTPLNQGMASLNSSTPVGVSGPAFGNGLTRNMAVWTVAGFDNYGRTFPVQLTNNWITPEGGPARQAHAPRLWRTERSPSGTLVQMAFADDVAPDSYRLPVDRADLQQAATRIDAELGEGLSLTFAAHGARSLSEAGDAIGHLDFVNADLSLSLTRELTETSRFSLIVESGEATVGLDGRYAERSATAARSSFDVGAHTFDVTLGRLEEEGALLGLAWANDLGQMPAGETRFAGVAWRYQSASGWRVGASGEYGVADLSQSAWLNVAETLRTTSFLLEAQQDLTPQWFGALGLAGAGVIRLSLSQPMRVEDGVLSFMAPTANEYGRRSLRYELRSFEPTPSGRELRSGLSYSYFSGQNLSAFGELIYVSEPGHVAGADADAILRVGLRVAN